MCKYCKELNEEDTIVEIREVEIKPHGCFYWECPIKYCPNCGKEITGFKIRMGYRQGIKGEK